MRIFPTIRRICSEIRPQIMFINIRINKAIRNEKSEVRQLGALSSFTSRINSRTSLFITTGRLIMKQRQDRRGTHTSPMFMLKVAVATLPGILDYKSVIRGVQSIYRHCSSKERRRSVITTLVPNFTTAGTKRISVESLLGQQPRAYKSANSYFQERAHFKHGWQLASTQNEKRSEKYEQNKKSGRSWFRTGICFLSFFLVASLFFPHQYDALPPDQSTPAAHTANTKRGGRPERISQKLHPAEQGLFKASSSKSSSSQSRTQARLRSAFATMNEQAPSLHWQRTRACCATVPGMPGPSH